jgi:SAM-dependent methyltransferase
MTAISVPAPPANAAGEEGASRFHRVYTRYAGRHPRLRPWHHQWLAGTPLYAVLRPALAELSGDVLDVGCGAKPYRDWVPGARRYVGIDVFDGPSVDGLIVPGRPWPVDDAAFDAVLCTQVLEHVADVEQAVAELARVMRPGAHAIISVPFIFGEHNAPHDYRRLSEHGVRRLLEDHDLEVVTIKQQGAIGSTLGSIFLCWTFDALPRSGRGLLVAAPLLPLWSLLCLTVNALGAALDRVDRTGMYYGNLVVHARRAA